MNKLLLLLGLILLNSYSNLTHEGELRVLSYNIRHGADAAWKMRLDDQADFLASRKADLISLQEVDQVCGRSGKVDEPQLFATKLLMQPVFQPFMAHDGGQYGIAALSKLPVLQVTPRHYAPGLGGEPRKFPLVKVSLGGREMLFVPIHFDWSSKDNTARKAQAQELIADLDKQGLPVILAGDFNDVPDSEVMKLFSAAGFSFKTGKKHTFHDSKNSKNPRQVEIDFIAVRSGKGLNLNLLKTHTIEQRELSDHAPVEAQVSWEVVK